MFEQYAPAHGTCVCQLFERFHVLLFALQNLQILSHTFSTISEDAQAEALFRRAVLTIEGFVVASFILKFFTNFFSVSRQTISFLTSLR